MATYGTDKPQPSVIVVSHYTNYINGGGVLADVCGASDVWCTGL